MQLELLFFILWVLPILVPIYSHCYFIVYFIRVSLFSSGSTLSHYLLFLLPAQILTAWPRLQMAAFNSHAMQATSCSTSTASAAGTSWLMSPYRWTDSSFMLTRPYWWPAGTHHRELWHATCGLSVLLTVPKEEPLFLGPYLILFSSVNHCHAI